MKNLLYKELRLCVPIQTWIFVFLSITIMIPSWPSLVSFFYPLAGLTVIFALGAANRDILYTSTLPIRKGDVVKGKTLLLSFLELLTILISIPFGILRTFFITLDKEMVEYPELGVNIAMFGFVFFLFGIFNLIVLPWFYKKPEGKNSLPFIIGDLATMVLMGVIMTVFMAVPNAAAFINTFEGIALWTQLGILLVGIALFSLFTFLALLEAKKAFQKVDI
ncbi:MAG TPA: hypothetical protein DCZ41_03500 [Firmicutes bacterium]|nr:hypothetical protein [Bacillota bacterium]